MGSNGGLQGLLSLNPTTVLDVLLFGLWLLWAETITETKRTLSLVRNARNEKSPNVITQPQLTGLQVLLSSQCSVVQRELISRRLVVHTADTRAREQWKSCQLRADPFILFRRRLKPHLLEMKWTL